MSHGDLDDRKGAEQWVREEAKQVYAQMTVPIPRGVHLRYFLQGCLQARYREWGWPLQVLREEAVEIFAEELMSYESPRKN